MPRLSASLLMALSALPGLAMADEHTVAEGRALAERWCASCHVIGPEIPGGDAGPTFRSIAGRYGGSANLIKIWLSDPHPPMPKLDLTKSEMTALSDYIVSLGP